MGHNTITETAYYIHILPENLVKSSAIDWNKLNAVVPGGGLMTKFGTNTLFGLIHDYLKIYLPKQRKLSPNTIRSYRGALEFLVDFVKEKKKIPLQDVTFEMLTADMIIGYLDYLETERACSITTRNNRLASIRAFLVFASDRDVTTVVQLNELKKVPVKKS